MSARACPLALLGGPALFAPLPSCAHHSPLTPTAPLSPPPLPSPPPHPQTRSNALRTRLSQLGYDLPEDQVNDLFKRFKNLADKKKVSRGGGAGMEPG